MPSKPRKNPHGAAGSRLWVSVTRDFELDPAETSLLHEACRCLDELARIDAALVGSPLLVEGSMHQPRPHPLLAEARSHRKTLADLLRSLALPLPGEAVGRIRSPQQTQAVSARHRGSKLRGLRGTDGVTA